MFAEFDKVVRCLAVELPESVHDDVVAKYGKLKAEVEKFTSTNTGSPKLLADTIEKYYESFIRDDGVDEVTASGAQEFRDFICQQLRADA